LGIGYSLGYQLLLENTPYIIECPQVVVSMGEVTALGQLAIAGLIEVATSRGFILKVYTWRRSTIIICIRKHY
jgi:hypothetical protein